MLELKDVLNWGSLDIEALNELIEKAELLEIYPEDIREYIENNYMNVTDINSWFHGVMSLMFYKIVNTIRNILDEDDEEHRELLNKLQEWEDDFSPYINYLDSWFNNPLDEIDWKSVETSEDLINKVIEILKSERGDVCE